MKNGTLVRVTNPGLAMYGRQGVVVGTYGMSGIRVRMPEDDERMSSVFQADELAEVTMKAGDRVKVVDQTNQFFNRAGTIQREAFSQIFIRFDGEPAVSLMPFTEGQLQAISRDADGQRGGKSIGRFKR